MIVLLFPIIPLSLWHIDHAYWIIDDCSDIIFVKHVKSAFFLSKFWVSSLIELRKRKPGFDSKFLNNKKSYNKTDFSAW